ncbi:hypothetical protein Psta_1495 [Pirellula staleyi DSM 6068]|uniref:Uncharacterized protein n=1 Tax=Pirellula staleyi (strain ATCC 27377 / DSM 6068 / ICPB 4128) TaxID=530564 RepID=D2QXI5_PIRSD|nr:hypothetical protein Psta_1495 [Pirellula staleyi DSM 6068]
MLLARLFYARTSVLLGNPLAMSQNYSKEVIPIAARVVTEGG